ncbi:MAG: hypothetical protein NZ526_01315 [Aquificaceae bacterium]|nr:hypothetical protein [Aquificaceae bacterium]
MPIVFVAWLGKSKEEKRNFPETSLLMVIPPFITAFLTLIFGVFQHQKLNPVTWVKLIASIEYGP